MLQWSTSFRKVENDKAGKSSKSFLTEVSLDGDKGALNPCNGRLRLRLPELSSETSDFSESSVGA